MAVKKGPSQSNGNKACGRTVVHFMGWILISEKVCSKLGMRLKEAHAEPEPVEPPPTEVPHVHNAERSLDSALVNQNATFRGRFVVPCSVWKPGKKHDV